MLGANPILYQLIVNVGYRLAPKNAYPTHLIDVKRAIRWMKLNIASFGGDPNFIVLSGKVQVYMSVRHLLTLEIKQVTLPVDI